MIAGLFGYVSYDAIRLIENLPDINYDELGIPDIRLIRPTVLIVLDAIKNELIVASPAWANDTILQKNYNNSVKRLRKRSCKLPAEKKQRKKKT